MAADGGCERDVVRIMNGRYKVWRALKRVPHEQCIIGIKWQEVPMKELLFKRCCTGQTHGVGMRVAVRRKVNVLEMKCLKSLVGVS